MIEIDTSSYERKAGTKPRGRAFWTFRLCSESVTSKDHFVHSDQPATYDAALARAKEIAGLRRCSRIVVEPPPG